MVKSIYLQDGEEIFVDDEDYERVCQHTWYKYYNHNTRNITNGNGKNRESLANFLVKNNVQKEKNNDFTKKNLINKKYAHRWRSANSNSSSKYKGVTFDKSNKKWLASAHENGKRKRLGHYSREDDAALAYNKWVDDYYDGEAYKNKIGYDNRILTRNYKTSKRQKIKGKTKSGYKGVNFNKQALKYQGAIAFKSKNYYIGYNNNKHKLALAYNKCALYLYENDVILNDVPMTDELKDFIANWEIPDKIKALKVGDSNE